MNIISSAFPCFTGWKVFEIYCVTVSFVNIEYLRAALLLCKYQSSLRVTVSGNKCLQLQTCIIWSWSRTSTYLFSSGIDHWDNINQKSLFGKTRGMLFLWRSQRYCARHTSVPQYSVWILLFHSVLHIANQAGNCMNILSDI